MLIFAAARASHTRARVPGRLSRKSASWLVSCMAMVDLLVMFRSSEQRVEKGGQGRGRAEQQEGSEGQEHQDDRHQPPLLFLPEEEQEFFEGFPHDLAVVPNGGVAGKTKATASLQRRR